jgi:predicted nuclease of restriction endonuclease-like RecB superfamily
MRANVAGDKAALARAKIKEDISCRKCHTQKETLGHILGQCIHTKKDRIRRHDDIKEYILQEVVAKDKEAVVTHEPTLRSSEGKILKPDLVIKNREGVFVVDVTVRHEDGDYLRLARKSKTDKYEILLPDLQQRMEAEKGEVLPIVIGTRGVIPNETLLALGKLNIVSTNKLTTISLMALRGSIEIYNNFMDYNAHKRDDPS